jgi:hypothetical protein
MGKTPRQTLLTSFHTESADSRTFPTQFVPLEALATTAAKKDRYHRTAWRHRLAAATVVLFDPDHHNIPLAAATFADAAAAHLWADKLSVANPHSPIVLLDRTGITVCVICQNPHHASLAATVAEHIWRRAKSQKPTPRPEPLTFHFLPTPD